MKKEHRKADLAAIWKSTHKDFRGAMRDGSKGIMIMRDGSSQIVALDSLTDAEVERLKPAKKERAITQLTFLATRVNSISVYDSGIVWSSGMPDIKRRIDGRKLSDFVPAYAAFVDEIRAIAKDKNQSWTTEVSYYDTRDDSSGEPWYKMPRNGHKPRGYKKALERGGELCGKRLNNQALITDEIRAKIEAFNVKARARRQELDAEPAPENAPTTEQPKRDVLAEASALPAPDAGDVAAYQNKIEGKRERYEERADKAMAEQSSRFDRARSHLPNPPDQPILVGHHSEKRHRAAIKRFDNNMRAGVEAGKKAEHYATKAASVGTGGIQSDDPEAIVKLKAKIERAEEMQTTMRDTNAAWRKAGKPLRGDVDGWARFQASTGWPQVRVDRLANSLDGSWHGKQPFAAYEMTNNNANIKRMKDRLVSLLNREHSRGERGDAPETTIGDVRIVEDMAAHRVQMFFPGKPSAEIRGELKRNGFRWARSIGAWQAHLSDGAKAKAKRIAENLCVASD